MGQNPPGSSVHRIFQAGILEWVAISFSRRSSQYKDQTCVSCVSCIGRQVLYLASSGNAVTVSTSNSNATAAFFTEHENELHTFRNVVTAPTCTEDGYTTHICVNCGYTYVNEKTDALNHDYEEVVTAPTCTEGGQTTYTCANCGDSYVTDQTEALEHAYVEVETVAPSCTEDGYTAYTCSRCGDSYRGDPVSALDHNFEDGSCTLCGEPEEDECVYLESKTLVSGETYILALGGRGVGTYTFTQVSGGWTIQLEDGTYLALGSRTSSYVPPEASPIVKL